MADNMASFLLEIGAEELPAGQILNIANHIKDGLETALTEAQLVKNSGRHPAKQSFASDVDTKEVGTVLSTSSVSKDKENFRRKSCIELKYTPRRLFFYVSGIDAAGKDREQVIKGPPEKVAKAADASMTQAALGFAKKNQVAEADLYFEDGYLYCKKLVKAQDPKEILAKAVPEIIASTPGVRFMRWANNDLKFARPLQWIAALIITGSKTQQVEFEVAGIKASNLSYGHRFLGPEAFEIKSREQYESQLEKQGTFIDPEKRKAKIVDEAKALAASVNAEIVLDDALLDEVIMITENPSPILCDFDAKFLEIPDCVLKTVMINHQRYIPVVANDKLLPYFIAVSNNPLETARANIKSGNQKVIVPRFKDAEFFVEEDMKIKLEQRLEKLARLNSLKGNLLEKSYRMEEIVKFLIEALGNVQDEVLILQATRLAKTDLNCNLVFEFTELQGEIGGVYARKQGYDEVVAKAIEEHYKPRFAGDDAPSTIGGKLIAIADKLDNIVAAFALGKIPSGSADPFALRRQANGMLEIILHGHMVFNIEALVNMVCKLQEAEFGAGEIITKIKGRGDKRQEMQVAELNWDGTNTKVIEFLETRMPFVFELAHKQTDLNRAVLAKPGCLAELDRRHQMIHLLYDLKTQADFASLVEAISRVSNIAESNADKVDSSIFELDYEKEFFATVESLAKNLEGTELLKSIKPINAFFDNVLVNADDAKIKANRKALVAYADSVFGQIGDFSLL